MIFNFPAHLTDAEDRLLKKIGKLKEKKKAYLETKSIREQKVAQKVASKRASIETPNSTNDAKETAKKLIKSGAIKLESEAKEKGFKRSLSRKDDHLVKKTGNLSPAMPSSTYSPSTVNLSPTVNRTKFPFPRHFSNSPSRFTSPPPNYQSNSLFIKGDKEISEEFLRTIFTANASEIQINSIEMKKTFAFVAVDSTKSAETAIKILNDQVYNNIKINVSYARPKQNSFNRKPSFMRRESSGEHSDTSIWNETVSQSNATYSTAKTPRNVISYDDNPDNVDVLN